MKRSVFLSLAVSVIASLTLLACYHIFFTKKMGYVKTGELLEKYEGMKNANVQFMEEIRIVQSNVDTLRSRLDLLKSRENMISDSEKKQWAMEVGSRENELEQYSHSADEQLKNRQVQLTEKVISEINKAIQDYGKANNYAFVFGTTANGNLIYAEEGDDLTEIILEKLNAEFSGSDE